MRAIKHEIRGDVTTTNPDCLSLNALEILAKRVSIGEWLVEHLVQVRVERRLKEVQQAKKRMEFELGQEMEKIKAKEQEINESMVELLRKEQGVNQR